MAALFRDCPNAVANTLRVAERCEFTLDNLGYRFPDYPVPNGGSQIEYLRTLTYEGARRRYGELTARVRRQLEHELALIGELELAGYFLIVWDIVRFCREQNILAQGRGSFTATLDHYEDVPSHIAEKVIESHRKELEAAGHGSGH